MLTESRLLSFMSTDECYAVHIFDGQKIIKDLAIIHNLKGKAFFFYRDCILSSLLFITLLKHGETLGFYIDSKDPKFSFKVEMADFGHMRTLMLPENFTDFPDKIKGQARLSKISREGQAPYHSVIELDGISSEEACNQVIRESYQMTGHVLLSDDSDQSILILKLPRKSWNKNELLQEGEPIESFTKKFKKEMTYILEEGKSNEQSIIKKMEKNDFYFLQGKDISFQCSCSRERMLTGVKSLLGHHTLDELFENESIIETKCDYCNTYYEIERSELIN